MRIDCVWYFRLGFGMKGVVVEVKLYRRDCWLIDGIDNLPIVPKISLQQTSHSTFRNQWPSGLLSYLGKDFVTHRVSSMDIGL